MAIIDAATRFPTLCVIESSLTPNLSQMTGRASKSTVISRISPLHGLHPGFADQRAGYLAFADNRAYMTLKFLIG
jgi:hypothetical protein